MNALKSRGMGRALCDSRNAQVLRRPAEAGIIQRFGNLATSEMTTFEKGVNELCESLSKLDFKSKVDFNPFVDKLKSLCTSGDDVVQCTDVLYKFSSKSKWNAHVCAMFCNAAGDLFVSETKLRTELLRKLQTNYNERNKKYLEIDNFIMDATFLFEIYYHVHINGIPLKVLVRPVIDYFGMLIDGGSQKEVEVLMDQFPKCFPTLKESDENGLETLLCKLRKQVICESSNVIARAMMVELFEKVLTDFRPLSTNAISLYESLSKPVVKICD